jgi:DNA-binding NarL/FixJ family response regulator
LLHRKRVNIMAVRIMYVNDHPLINFDLESFFKQQEDFELVAHCSEVKKTLQFVRVYNPDIVVLDINMTGEYGLLLIKEILAEKLPLRVVVYAVIIDKEHTLEAIHAGVHGIVLQETLPVFLIQCIRKVCAGEKSFDRRSARRSLENILRQEAAARSTSLLAHSGNN